MNIEEKKYESAEGAGQFLTFKLSDEIFGFDVSQVREILEYVKITKVPQTPKFMCGVLNLRGGVVPVINMRLKFGMEESEVTVNTCIIVVEVTVDNEKNVIGVIVDSVQEVFELDMDQIEPPPRIGTRLNTEFIRGMGKNNENFIMILNIDKIFSADEIEFMSQAAAIES